MVSVEQVRGMAKVAKPIVKSARITKEDNDWLLAKGVKFQALVDAALKEMRGEEYDKD
jgi:hypothetical protein